MKSLDDIQPKAVASIEIRESTIFSEKLLMNNEIGRKAPLIVCGLPRSGSSLLSELLTQSCGYYVFDDLYLKRKVEQHSCYGELSSEQIDFLLDFLGWQIKARIRFKPYSVPMMLQEDVERMNQSIKHAFTSQKVNWVELQKEWLVRLAMLNGCKGWGFNHPAAVRNLNEYDKLFPGANYVFLHRAPDQVMASYKHMPKGHVDGTNQRYQPIVYASYWKFAVKNYINFKKNNVNRAIDIKFEDIINKPQESINSIADFFAFSSNNPVQLIKPNSSFGRKRKSITGLELFILKVIANREAKHMNYDFKNTDTKFLDIFDFFKTSITFAFFTIKTKLIKK